MSLSALVRYYISLLMYTVSLLTSYISLYTFITMTVLQLKILHICVSARLCVRVFSMLNQYLSQLQLVQQLSSLLYLCMSVLVCLKEGGEAGVKHQLPKPEVKLLYR